MAKTKPGDPAAVEEYLEALPDDDRIALERMRELVHRSAPKATERVSYGIIAFSHHGDLVGIGAHPRHLSLYTMSPPLVKQMKERLSGVKVSGATLHFSAERPLPDDLVAEIVAARMAANEAH